jgi:hypothetical protein
MTGVAVKAISLSWFFAVLGWAAFSLIGGGSINMAVGLTIGAFVITVVIAVFDR